MPIEVHTDIRLIGASVRGPSHVEKGIPCQDAVAFQAMNGCAVIAIADGLGSAVRSEVGAGEAVRAAVAFVIERAKSQPGAEANADTCREAAGQARRAVEAKATELNCPLRDLACTFMVIVLRRDAVYLAHIGDGAVVGQSAGGLVLLSGPGDSEYANEVLPLTATAWETGVRTASFPQEFLCVAAFTDGCQRAALRRSPEGYTPHEGFFQPVFDYARQLSADQDGNGEIRDLLDSPKLKENSEDDKSFVIAVLASGGEAHVTPDPGL